MRNRQRAHDWGLLAEHCAAWWLRCKGYRVLSMRYRNTGGEIDIVACKRDVLAVVEVKARATEEAALEAVTPMKRQRMQRAAESLLARPAAMGLASAAAYSIRFDVITVRPWRIPKHTVDAWRI